MKKGLGETKLINVNIPKLKTEEIKGIKVCRQAHAKWEEKFHEAIDPRGNKYYWLTGEFVNLDEGEDTDVWALDNGFISIVPSKHDLTKHEAIEPLKNFENITI